MINKNIYFDIYIYNIQNHYSSYIVNLIIVDFYDQFLNNLPCFNYQIDVNLHP